MKSSSVLERVGGQEMCECAKNLWGGEASHAVRTAALRRTVEWMLARTEGVDVVVDGGAVKIMREGNRLAMLFVFVMKGVVGVHVDGRRCVSSMALEDEVQLKVRRK
jgi:hypothetical protein